MRTVSASDWTRTASAGASARRGQQRSGRAAGIGHADAPEPFGVGHRLRPRLLAQQPDDIEDVEQIAVDVEVAQVIAADEVDEGRRRPGHRRRANRGYRTAGPAGHEVVVEDGIAFLRGDLEGEMARLGARRGEALFRPDRDRTSTPARRRRVARRCN